MHPAFSVIFFTTLSGMGYGLWVFIACETLLSGPDYPQKNLFGLLLGFVLVSIGLLSSTLHLGKPLRAWRAFSQWRSSWLSREGVSAIACFIPATLWMAQEYFHHAYVANSVLAVVLAALSIITVVCTAMIYASLKPIPAWRHSYVVIVYVLFALLTGGLLSTSISSYSSSHVDDYLIFGFVLLAVLLNVLKKRYWKDIDTQTLPSRASALGLKENKIVSVFERPHTEANYLTTEMGFVLARKHSRKLRTTAMFLFTWLPVLLCLASWLLPQIFACYLLFIAASSAYLGAAVERWLFFAEAKHAVMQYY
ncbi:MAG: DmsC/YnfH family molybdoenzyme membrane anchor subunit [Arenimonas sp.]